MKLHLTRDSVAAGDDGDAPHHRDITLPDGIGMPAVVAAIAGARYLPSIQGGQATWSLTSRRPVAVLAQQWREPKMLFLLDPDDLQQFDFANGTLRVHATYHTQIDPDLVYRVLWQLRGGALE